jgi:hypothetical protein
MLKKHKNALLETIAKRGFDPARFEAREEDSRSLSLPHVRLLGSRDDSFKIFLRDSPMQFNIANDDQDFFSLQYQYREFTPGFPMTEMSSYMPFESAELHELTILSEFNRWLNNTVRSYIDDAELPDLWAQLNEYRSIVSPSDNPQDEESDFSPEEKQELRAVVGRFHELVSENFEPTPEQEAFITERLDYLTKAADRLNRFDWRGVALSIVLSIGVNLAVDTSTGPKLLHLFQQAFQGAKHLLR